MLLIDTTLMLVTKTMQLLLTCGCCINVVVVCLEWATHTGRQAAYCCGVDLSKNYALATQHPCASRLFLTTERKHDESSSMRSHLLDRTRNVTVEGRGACVMFVDMYYDILPAEERSSAGHRQKCTMAQTNTCKVIGPVVRTFF